MSLRTVVRLVLGVVFVFVAVPAVMLWVGSPGELRAAPGMMTGVVVEEHGDHFDGRSPETFLTLVTDSDRFSLTGPGAKWVKPGQKVRVQAPLRGGMLELAGPGAIQVLAENATPPRATYVSSDDDVAGLAEQDASDSLAGADTVTAAASPAITKRVAVLMVNFVSPTPAPTPSPTPCVDPPTPDPTPTPDPEATPDPDLTPDPDVTPSPEPSMCPAPTPTPTPAPTATPPPQPWTRSEVAGYYFNNTKSVRTFYDELSNGKMLVTGDVFGWYTLTMTLTTCDYNGIATKARAAATAAGVNLANYTNLSYVFPKVSACGWGGLANVNGPNSWINGKNAMGVYVPAHELGHNFGAHHANALTCTSGGTRVQYSNNCTSAEYADPFDLMGSNASSSGGIRHMHTWHRKQIGVLTTADQQTVTASGTYTVATAAVAGGAPRILRVAQDSSNSKYYYLEFRQPYGLFDNWSTSSNAVNGVMIRLAPNTSRVQSQLIDANPATSGFGDAPLAVGQKFVDSVNQRTIITRSISATGATVYIQVGPDVTAPTAPGTLSASLASATSVSLAWGAAFDEIGVTGYRVSRDGVLLGTVSGLTFTDTNVPQGGTRRYTVAARDAAGNVGPAVTRDIVVPDTLAPSAPGGLTAVATGPSEVSLTWTAATDNVSVTGYRVTRGGTLLGTVSTLSYSATGLVMGTTYTFAVAARDAAGNVGPAVSVSLTMPDAAPPTAPGSLTVSAMSDTSITLTWTPATDNVGVAGYQVMRDGTLVGTTAATTFEDVGVSVGVVYSYAVAAYDAAGNVGPAATMSVDPVGSLGDTTAPSVVAPAAVLLGNVQAAATKVPLSVSWSAVDASGIASYELQQSKNGGTWKSVALAAPTQTSVTLNRPPGNTFRFRVRATDGAGNTSAWAAAPTFKIVARQEKHTSIKYSATWTSVSSSSAFGGALRHAKASTATATLTFTGRSVSWISSRGTNRGVADVYVDGVKVATVDLAAASLQMRRVVFTQNWSSVGTHTIQVRVRGTSGRPRVDLDAFVFLK